MKLVSPENFNVEQKKLVETLKGAIILMSSQTDIIFGAKDIHSRHLISTDSYARLVGLSCGLDVENRFDHDMPCEGTAQFADCYVREDQELLRQTDINQKKSILNVHEYSDGIDALIFEKYLIKHSDSESVLGTLYSARKVEISDFLSLIPNYIIEFGVGCSIGSANPASISKYTKFTDYEHEICFLLALNWSFNEIAQFMNKYRPASSARSTDAIYKCRNRICEKLDCHPSRLRDTLVGMGVHQKMPTSFFRRLIGSRSL